MTLVFETVLGSVGVTSNALFSTASVGVGSIPGSSLFSKITLLRMKKGRGLPGVEPTPTGAC